MSLRALLLFSLTTLTPVLSTPIAPRQDLITASTIQQDILNINSGVLSLDAHTNAYDGSPASALPLAGDFLAIHLANRKGYADANLRVQNFTAQESSDIVQTVIDTVGNSIPKAVNDTVAKKELFEAGGQQQVVLGTFQVLLNDHDTFSEAVSRHFSADMVRGAAVVKKIHDAIQGGIDAYSS